MYGAMIYESFLAAMLVIYDYKSLHQPEWAVAIFCSRQAGVIIDGFRKHDATSKTT